MTAERGSRVGSRLAILVVVLGVTAWSLAVHYGINRPVGQPRLQGTDVLWAASFSAFLALGALVARRRPANPVGWCLAFAPLLIGVGVGVFEYIADPARPATVWVGLVANPAFDLGSLLLALWLLWYPDGVLPSPRWRWVVRGAVVAYAVSVLSMIFSPAPYSQDMAMRSPFAVERPLIATVNQGVDLAVPIVFLLGFASLVVRFRRADPLVRGQLKTLVYAVAVVATAAAALTAVSALVGPSELIEMLGFILVVAALLCVPASVAVAVVRHGAFDIDRAISRTLSYAIVTVVLVGLYAGGVVALGAFARSVTGETGDLVVALSTLTVAAAFAPVRRHVQSMVDRRFNRARVDSLRAVDEFGRRLRDEVDPAAVVADLRGTVLRTLLPSNASVVTVVGSAASRDRQRTAGRT